MDLRPYKLSGPDVEAAKKLLSYQPFILADTVITGCGHSFLHESDPEKPELFDGRFLFELDRVERDKFQRAFDANLKLIRTYEHFIDVMARAFAPGTYLDVSCNTGLFPVMGALRGFQRCVGIDPKPFGDAVGFLNRITGTSAEFVHGGYLSKPQGFYARVGADVRPFAETFDVVSNLAFLCHLGEPLQFLHELASLARKAVFLWSGFVESDEYIIRFNRPRPEKLGQEHRFFYQKFSSGSAPSTKLLFASMSFLGFSRAVEIDYPMDGLPPDWTARHMPHFQPFRAFLFIREPFYAEYAAKVNPAGARDFDLALERV